MFIVVFENGMKNRLYNMTKRDSVNLWATRKLIGGNMIDALIGEKMNEWNLGFRNDLIARF